MALRLDTPLKVPPKSLPLDPENKKVAKKSDFSFLQRGAA